MVPTLWHCHCVDVNPRSGPSYGNEPHSGSSTCMRNVCVPLPSATTILCTIYICRPFYGVVTQMLGHLEGLFGRTTYRPIRRATTKQRCICRTRYPIVYLYRIRYTTTSSLKVDRSIALVNCRPRQQRQNSPCQPKDDTTTNRCLCSQLASIRLLHPCRICAMQLRSLSSPSPKASIPSVRFTERMRWNSETPATMVEVWR